MIGAGRPAAAPTFCTDAIGLATTGASIETLARPALGVHTRLAPLTVGGGRMLECPLQAERRAGRRPARKTAWPPA